MHKSHWDESTGELCVHDENDEPQRIEIKRRILDHADARQTVVEALRKDLVPRVSRGTD